MNDPRTLGQKIADAAHENMPSLREPGPKLPTGPAEGVKTQPHEVELMGLSVVVTVLERMNDAERRRALNYLNDRYGEPPTVAVAGHQCGNGGPRPWSQEQCAVCLGEHLTKLEKERPDLPKVSCARGDDGHASHYWSYWFSGQQEDYFCPGWPS